MPLWIKKSNVGQVLRPLRGDSIAIGAELRYHAAVLCGGRLRPSLAAWGATAQAIEACMGPWIGLSCRSIFID